MAIYADIVALKDEALSAISQVKDAQELEALRLRYLGKKGQLTALLRGMGALPAEERPQAGQLINSARVEIETLLDEKNEAMQLVARDQALKAEAIDITLPRPLPRVGHIHPLERVLREVLEGFVGLGFEVVEGPEIEKDYYNFELLNMPPNHPARDAQDTFYIDDKTVLRTHTSPVQARVMTTRKPPIRVVCPGRVFRADEVDATHSPVFHQIEGLVIDKQVSMADLKGTLDAFAAKLYGEDVHTRFRPGYFPFTEPSAEIDFTCFVCRGKGCRVCKQSGYIEILGSGMVNPKVLELCGIDPNEYTGFAFGIGLERITMLRYGIEDIRLLYEGDERFLRQFR